MDIKIQIDVFSHYFRVRLADPSLAKYMYQFSARLMLTDRSDGKTEPKLFATKFKGELDFRFHIGMYKDFLTGLYKAYPLHDEINITVAEMYEPVSIDVIIDPKWVLRDYQEEVVDFAITDSPDDLKSRLIALPTGQGKFQSLSSLVKIPGSWKKMGDIELGDVVTAVDGTPSKVIGVYPQGVKDIFELTFYDGRTARCGDEHLWRVYAADGGDKWSILSLSEIRTKMATKTHSTRTYIELIEPEIIQDVELPIDPYLLGLLIGDGCLTRDCIYITNPDQFIIDEVRSIIPEDMVLKLNGKCGYRFSSNQRFLINKLKDLGLWGKYSYQKHIPEMYLNSSTSQRLSLLQGLLDTDGTVGVPGGSVSYSTSSPKLADDVCMLVRSLGGIAHKGHKTPHYTHKGVYLEGRPAFVISIRHRKPSSLFRLPRKKMLTNDDNQYSHKLKLRIESIEPVGQEESQCIAIDHPKHMYVTDNYVATHNTICACVCLAKIKHRTAIVILPAYIPKWIEDVKKTIISDDKKILVIQGSKQLKDLIALAQQGELHQYVIIFSLVTLRNFYKSYLDDDYTEYQCEPDKLWELLGVGTIVIDEVHQHLHAIFTMLAHTHVPKVIALSATLLSSDPVLEEIQHSMFPKGIRFDKIKMNKYIKLYSIGYSFEDMQKSRIRTTEHRSNSYSHNAFERSVLRSPSTLTNYMKLIHSVVKTAYMENFMPEDKLLIFASTKLMCDAIVKYFKEQYPNYDIRRYVEEDPHENLMEAQISVSTHQSAGTAEDISGLRAVVQTVNVASPVTNYQNLGRLRELKDRDVKYYYLYCIQIPKHMQYHRERTQLFSDRTASMKDFRATSLV